MLLLIACLSLCDFRGIEQRYIVPLALRSRPLLIGVNWYPLGLVVSDGVIDAWSPCAFWSTRFGRVILDGVLVHHCESPLLTGIPLFMLPFFNCLVGMESREELVIFHSDDTSTTKKGH